MNIGILGTGVVGQTLAAGLAAKGHVIKIGTRDPKAEKIQSWLKDAAKSISVGTFAEAAQFGEVVILATQWGGTENAIQLTGADTLAGKTVIDVTNPLGAGPDGTPWAVGYTDSAGERVQRWLPKAHVVKAWNHMPAAVMVDANVFGDTASAFIAGENAGAKQTVSELLRGFGFDPIDLGGIQEARLTEALTMLWVRYYGISQSWQHAFKLIHK